MRCVVLGAGPAGLGAAEALSAGGAQVTVLEARSRVGGLAGSERIGGHSVDLGPHRLHLEADDEVRGLLGGVGFAVRPRLGTVHLKGRAVRYPPRPRTLLRDAGPGLLLRFALGALGGRIGGLAGGDDDFASETTRRVGGPLLDALYGPAARKVWGKAPDALHGDQARARVGAAGPLALLARAFSPWGGGEPGRYLYPAAGSNQAAFDAWAARLRARGVAMQLDAPVTGVERRGGRVALVAAGGARLAADAVVSTLPVQVLLALLEPAPRKTPPLRSRAVVLLHLVVARPRLTERDVHYFPGDDAPFARLTEQRAFGAAASAPRGETALTLDFYDDALGPRTHASPQALLDEAWPALARFGLSRDEIGALLVTVASDAYPVLDRAYRAARDAALDALAAVAGLYGAGRGGLFLHINQHHAVRTGLAAGRAALRRASGAEWRREARAFEAFRIVD